ncbi:MAG TPA: hypothetical protein DD490_02270, partial [Acidobacteria bacterium]|nr:hypothetical protein [Acidobacteriota bacterium]
MAAEGPRGDGGRGDALAPSGHSRLSDELRPPQDDFDEVRAAAVCGSIARDLLGDFAPAVLLLAPLDRERLQALLAYTRTLFDFAR